MALFIPDDPGYDRGIRQTGFNRYRQLLEERWTWWLRAYLITFVGAVPLFVAIAYSILSTSVLLLIPLSILGGMIFGPFVSGLFDVYMRTMRDATGTWWEMYRKGFLQNWKKSLLPGGLFGLFTGFYTFMGFLFYWQTIPVDTFSLIVYLLSGLLVLGLNTLFWSLFVLFDQPFRRRLVNMIAFSARYLWKVLGTSVMLMITIVIAVMFAPWTLFVIPFLGWYFRFLSLYFLYDSMDDFFSIEERIEEEAE